MNAVNNNREGKIQSPSYKTSQYEGLGRLFKDIYIHTEKGPFWLITVISGLLTVVMYFVPCCKCNFMLSAITSLFGFTITAYTIMFALSERIQNRLQEKANDKKVPAELMHSTFIMGLLFQALTLISGCVIPALKIHWAISILHFLFFFSVLWSIHTALHLYSLRTFLR